MNNPAALKTLGLRIKTLRQERKLSQEELGLRSGVTEQTIQRLEAAKHGTSIDSIISIANALNTNLKDLFNFEYPKSSNLEN